MPDKTFKVGEDTYAIPEDKVQDFLKDFPEASEIQEFSVGDDVYEIPIDQRNNFLKDFPNAIAVGTNAPISQPEPDAKPEPEPEEDRNFLADVFNSFQRGSAHLGSMLARTPGYLADAIYTVGAIPQNILANVPGLESLRTSPKQFREMLGAQGDNAVAEYYDTQVQLLQESQREKFDKGLTDYFLDGEIGKFTRSLTNQVFESLPVMLGIMAGGLAGAGVKGAALGSAVLGAGEREAMRQDPDMAQLSEEQQLVNSLTKGTLEFALESAFGVNKALKILAEKAFKEGGEKAAREVAENAYKEIYTPAFKRHLGVAGEEFLTESATQLGQNVVDIISGKDIGVFDNVVDAGIVGLGSSGLFTGVTLPFEIAARKETRNKLQEIQNKKQRLEEDLRIPAPDNIKGAIESERDKLQEQENEVIKKEKAKIESLPQESQDKVIELRNQVNEIERVIEQGAHDGTAIEVLEKKKNELESEIDKVIGSEEVPAKIPVDYPFIDSKELKNKDVTLPVEDEMGNVQEAEISATKAHSDIKGRLTALNEIRKERDLTQEEIDQEQEALNDLKTLYQRLMEEELTALFPGFKAQAEGPLDFGGLFGGITQSLYTQLFEMAKEGKDVMAGVKQKEAPLLNKLYKEGKLKGPEDVRIALNPKAQKVIQKYEGKIAEVDKLLQNEPTPVQQTVSPTEGEQAGVQVPSEATTTTEPTTTVQPVKKPTELNSDDVIRYNGIDYRITTFHKDGSFDALEVGNSASKLTKATVGEELFEGKVVKSEPTAQPLNQTITEADVVKTPILQRINKAFLNIGSVIFDNAKQLADKAKELAGVRMNVENAGFETRDGNPIGFRYDTDKVARERFDFSKLKQIGKGSDRTVFALGNGRVLKVAHTARGLEQNIYEGDYYLDSIIPEVFERGLNYVVVEDTPRIKAADVVPIYDVDGNLIEGANQKASEMLKEFREFTQNDFDKNNNSLQDVLTKYGFQDILGYDVIWGDFIAQRNWGYKNGRPVHLDGGTFGGVKMITNNRGKKSLSDPEFREIYNKSRELKKQFGDTDKNTRFNITAPDGRKLSVKPVNADVVNGFYSPLEKIINEAKQDKLPVKQWIDKFARGEEAKWTGLTDWLNAQQGSVSKADIQQYLKDNRVQILEVNNADKANDPLVKEFQRQLDEFETDEKRVAKLAKVEGGPEFGAKWRSIFDETYAQSLERRLGNIPYTTDGDGHRVVQRSSIPGRTKYSEYQLEGEKSNYKEVLVTLPPVLIENIFLPGQKTESAKSKFQSGHFDEPDILVHLRMNTRTDADGKKVLFLEEVQSDWGQKGRTDGFKKSEIDKQKADADFVRVLRKTDNLGFFSQREAMESIKVADNWQSEVPKKLTEEDIKIVDTWLEREKQIEQVPTAPFVTDTNAWTKLGLKVALKEAVKQGADRIAWTTGEQQNERYDLSKQVDAINWSTDDKVHYVTLEGLKGVSDQNLELIVNKKDGKITSASDAGTPREWIDKPLSDVIGKDVAEKILAKESGSLKGEGLKAGGTGMVGFYGNPSENKLGIIGNVAKKLFKQDPKTVEIGIGKDNLSDKQVKIIQQEENQNLYDVVDEGNVIGTFDRYIDAVNAKRDAIKEDTSTQHSIDVTPELKAQVEEGLPLFHLNDKGEILGFTHNGKIYLNGEKITAKTTMEEAGHIWINWAKENRPDLHKEGLQKVAGTPYLSSVRDNKNYQKEALKQGKKGSAAYNNYMREEALAKAIADQGDKFVSESKKKDFKEWVKQLWKNIIQEFGIRDLNPSEVQKLTLEEFAKKVAADVFSKNAPESAQSRSESTSSVSGTKPQTETKAPQTPAEKAKEQLSIAQKIDRAFFGARPGDPVSQDAELTASLYDAVAETFANKMGITKGEFWDRAVRDIIKTTTKNAELLAGNKPSDRLAKGATIGRSGSPKILAALENADKTTALHELAHIYEDFINLIDPKARQTVLDDFNAKTGKNLKTWNREVSEHFADSWLNYLSAPDNVQKDNPLRRAFENFSDWLKGIFSGAKANRVRITPEMQSIFDQVLGIERTDLRNYQKGKALAYEAVKQHNIPMKKALFDKMLEFFGKVSPYQRNTVAAHIREASEKGYALSHVAQANAQKLLGSVDGNGIPQQRLSVAERIGMAYVAEANRRKLAQLHEDLAESDFSPRNTDVYVDEKGVSYMFKNGSWHNVKTNEKVKNQDQLTKEHKEFRRGENVNQLNEIQEKLDELYRGLSLANSSAGLDLGIISKVIKSGALSRANKLRQIELKKGTPLTEKEARQFNTLYERFENVQREIDKLEDRDVSRYQDNLRKISNSILQKLKKNPPKVKESLESLINDVKDLGSGILFQESETPRDKALVKLQKFLNKLIAETEPDNLNTLFDKAKDLVPELTDDVMLEAMVLNTNEFKKKIQEESARIIAKKKEQIKKEAKLIDQIKKIVESTLAQAKGDKKINGKEVNALYQFIEQLRDSALRDPDLTVDDGENLMRSLDSLQDIYDKVLFGGKVFENIDKTEIKEMVENFRDYLLKGKEYNDVKGILKTMDDALANELKINRGTIPNESLKEIKSVREKLNQLVKQEKPVTEEQKLEFLDAVESLRTRFVKDGNAVPYDLKELTKIINNLKVARSNQKDVTSLESLKDSLEKMLNKNFIRENQFNSPIVRAVSDVRRLIRKAARQSVPDRETIDNIIEQLNNLYDQFPDKIDFGPEDLEAITSNLRDYEQIRRIENVEKEIQGYDGIINKIKNGDYNDALALIQSSREKVDTHVSPELRDQLKKLANIREQINLFEREQIRSKFGRVLYDLNSFWRALTLSFDASFLGIHGALYAYRYPIATIGHFKEAFLAGVNEEHYDEVSKRILDNKTYMRSQTLPNSLRVTELGGQWRTGIEDFPSDIVRRIRFLGIGRAYAASERAFSTFVNLTRMHAFEAYAKSNPLATDTELSLMADQINSYSGGSRVGYRETNFEQALPALTFALIAPRMYFSFFKTLYNLTLVPDATRALIAKDPNARKAYRNRLKESVKILAALSLPYIIAAGLGADIEDDPRDSEFLSIGYKDRRITPNPIVGYLRFVTKLGLKGLNSSGTFYSEEPEHQYFNSLTSLDILFGWGKYKFSPLPQATFSLISGQNAIGQPIYGRTGLETAQNFSANLLPIPIPFEQAYEFWPESFGGPSDIGIMEGTGLSTLALAGFSAVSYANDYNHVKVERFLEDTNLKSRIRARVTGDPEWNKLRKGSTLNPLGYYFRQDYQNQIGNYILNKIESGDFVEKPTAKQIKRYGELINSESKRIRSRLQREYAEKYRGAIESLPVSQIKD